MIVLQLNSVNRNTSSRPTQCPHCEGETGQRWGTGRRAIKDPRIRSVQVPRYKCTQCQRTFPHNPQGVSHSQQSERMKHLAVICWTFGFSYRKLEAILSAFGVRLRRMSGWRDVQAGAKMIRRRKAWKPVRVVGIDGPG